jgi:hypothetical protein
VGLGRVTAPINRDSLWPSSSEALACNLDRWIKNFNGRPFFSCFFIARANLKIRILALGGASIEVKLANRPLTMGVDLGSPLIEVEEIWSFLGERSLVGESLFNGEACDLLNLFGDFGGGGAS